MTITKVVRKRKKVDKGRSRILVTTKGIEWDPTTLYKLGSIILKFKDAVRDQYQKDLPGPNKWNQQTLTANLALLERFAKSINEAQYGHDL